MHTTHRGAGAGLLWRPSTLRSMCRTSVTPYNIHNASIFLVLEPLMQCGAACFQLRVQHRRESVGNLQYCRHMACTVHITPGATWAPAHQCWRLMTEAWENEYDVEPLLLPIRDRKTTLAMHLQGCQSGPASAYQNLTFKL